ncbi:hypothetical protein PENTCL1PPCAC_26205, partial [Pristionchus entomophagus]
MDGGGRSLHVHTLNDLVLDLLLLQYRRAASLEPVIAFDGLRLVAEVGDNGATEDRLLGSDHHLIERVSGCIVSVHSRMECLLHQLARFLLLHSDLEVLLQHGDGCITARSLCSEGTSHRRAIGRHVEQIGTSRVNATDEKVGSDVSHVVKEMLLRNAQSSDNTSLATSVELQESQRGREHLAHLIQIGGSSSSAGVYRIGDVVNLLTVFVGDDVACGGTRVCSHHHSILICDSNNGSSGRVESGRRRSHASERAVASAVGEVERIRFNLELENSILESVYCSHLSE